MAIIAVFLALALGQAPPDAETWLRAAREIPPAPDAAQERATLERIAKGFEMRDVHIRAAPAHAGTMHEAFTSLGASVQCHDVTATGSLIDLAYFVPAAARLLRPSVLEAVEIVPLREGDLKLELRVAFPTLSMGGVAQAQAAVRVLELVRNQPRPTTTLLRLAQALKGAPVRLTRVRQAETLEIEALAAGLAARESFARALQPAGIENPRLTQEARGGCAVLRMAGQGSPATQEEEDAAREGIAGLDPFLYAGDSGCRTDEAVTVLTARRQGTVPDGVFIQAREASRGEALAALEIATGRPFAGIGAPVRMNLDLAGVSADDALLALREAGAPLRPFAGFHLWTAAAGPLQTQEYTGAPVNIFLECADLRDVFRIFSEVSGLEFRPTAEVRGCVDLFATERPWDEVVDGVLAAAGLVRRIEGTAVIVRPAGPGPGLASAPPRSAFRVALDQLTAADLRLTAFVRFEGQWRAFARGPLPGRYELVVGTKLADGVVKAVDDGVVTVESGARAIRLSLP